MVATFNYEVKSYMRMTNGDRQTLLREAEAITALASERFSISACPSCATPVTDDSHFCRGVARRSSLRYLNWKSFG